MSTLTMRTATLLDALPPERQQAVYEIVKQLVLAWDPDYTKLTPDETAKLEQAEKAIESGDCDVFNSVEELFNSLPGSPEK